MINFFSFSDELVKIANSRLIAEGEKKLLLHAGIPLVGRLPKDPEKARERLGMLVESEKAHPVLGYKNVAVRESAMPDLAAMGFKPTRIATPLPGEKAFTTSWRSGTLHTHKLGPLYMVHKDKAAPNAGRFGYFSVAGVKHGITEGIPSLVKRLREKELLVKEFL